MSRPIHSRTQQLAAAAAMKATGGPLDACQLHLFKNDIEIGPYTKLADFEPPTFTGYAPSGPIVWGAPVIGPGVAGEIHGDDVQFTNTADGADDVIFGYYVAKSSTPLDYSFACRFDVPVPIANAGDYLIVSPTYFLPQP